MLIKFTSRLQSSLLLFTDAAILKFILDRKSNMDQSTESFVLLEEGAVEVPQKYSRKT